MQRLEMDFLVSDKFEGWSVLDVMRRELGMSHAMIKHLKFKDGGITLNGEHVTVRGTVHAGDKLCFDSEDKSTPEKLTPSNIPLRIAYEDEDVVVPDKSADMPTHQSFGHYGDTVANALAHRTWDVPAHVRVSMFPDRVEVVSPGGLPTGVTVDDYLAGNLSILRNPILGGVLFRLNVIEQFGTGVRRIRRGYAGSNARPRFGMTEGSISVILPVLDAKPALDRDEEKVLSAFSPGVLLSSSQVVALTGFGKDKVLRVLKELAAKGLIRIQGSGRGTRYVMS
jgi:hypothetical protein